MGNILRVVIVTAVLQLCLASQVWAFAVGELAIYSRQGEPLLVEVPLFLEAREREKGIEVALGTQETYRAEGVKRPPLIDVLTAVVVGSGDAIRISSQVSIREPQLPLLLSIRVGRVTIVKHYHLTLPAPSPAMTRPVVPLPTIAQVTPASHAHTSAPKAKTVRPSPRRPERYGPVERGDTLYSVARSLPITSDKIWQTIVVLWRSNKEQFTAGNLHGLNAETYLHIPPDLSESVTTLRLAEAQEIVASQWEEWQALQRLGADKRRVITAATRDPEVAIAAYNRREAASRPEPIPKPTDKPIDRPAPQAVILPVGKTGHVVSMAELQQVLQGLEERLTRRLIPSTTQELKGTTPTTTAFVSASELQASIQNLEERLTQRMQQMLLHTPTPEPILVAQRSRQHTLQLVPMPQAGDTPEPSAMTLVPYLLVLTNLLLLILVGVLVWLWVRRRDRAERMQRV